MAGERHNVGFAEAFVTADKTHELMAVDARSFQDRGPDDRIETWGVASAGEHSNLHPPILSGWKAHGVTESLSFP